jgi:hypothetical protein
VLTPALISWFPSARSHASKRKMQSWQAIAEVRLITPRRALMRENPLHHVIVLDDARDVVYDGLTPLPVEILDQIKAAAARGAHFTLDLT